MRTEQKPTSGVIPDPPAPPTGSPWLVTRSGFCLIAKASQIRQERCILAPAYPLLFFPIGGAATQASLRACPEEGGAGSNEASCRVLSPERSQGICRTKCMSDKTSMILGKETG